MNTDKLIDELVADFRTVRPHRQSMILAIVLSTLASGGLFFLLVGFRPDALQAMLTLRFLFKFVVTLTLSATAIPVVLRIGVPSRDTRAFPVHLAFAPGLLVLAVILEMQVIPRELWAQKLVGVNSVHCLTMIPALALPILAAQFVALRQGAPESPAAAGAVAGIVATAISATFYASNCTDDSPLFVATWYPLAGVIVIGLGAWAGSRLLRW